MLFPGHDASGFVDPETVSIQVFASMAARDTWCTAHGGIAAGSPLRGKFICIVDTGAAWTLNFLTLAGLWKTVALV